MGQPLRRRNLLYLLLLSRFQHRLAVVTHIPLSLCFGDEFDTFTLHQGSLPSYFSVVLDDLIQRFPKLIF